VFLLYSFCVLRLRPVALLYEIGLLIKMKEFKIGVTHIEKKDERVTSDGLTMCNGDRSMHT
jgi:hypothetical protein